MAKPKWKKNRQRRHHREPVVRRVAELLDTGTPTKWRWTTAARHGLRAAMCMKGIAWAIADARAEEIVTLARHRIGLSHYPSWIEARGDMPQEREFWYCAGCGGRIDGGYRRPWCGEDCRLLLKARHRRNGRRGDDAARQRFIRVVLTGGTEQPKAPRERRCKHCERHFEPVNRTQRYCSRTCFGRADRRLISRDCLICARPFSPKGPAKCCGPDCIAEKRRRTLREVNARRRVWHTKACAICGSVFKSARSVALYCGNPKCTKEAGRRAERLYRCRKREAAASPGEEGPPLELAAD
ncbi:hypothetical protein [Reyranella soli]|uniref:Uncharacterized protein n=1 Tax=Reyranella soli TaxID=1230389 RepID=A0A512N591_9HYPH|nr:hypothetical protein [Reyranella soli]GEP54174.1 hypothetical protein RSO01_13400 [Reyranella soli]